MLRRRVRYAALALLTIGLGLALVRLRGALPTAAADKLGDALWAAMMFWWVSAAWPDVRPARRAIAAVGIAWAVEASQLVRAPWLDALRATRLGHLVLGADFDAADLVAYAAGVAAAFLIDRRAGKMLAADERGYGNGESRTRMHTDRSTDAHGES